MDLSKGTYEERLKDGELLLYSRNRIFYARIYKGEATRRYLFRSLKTKDLNLAREKADEFFHEIRIKKRDNLPLDTKRFNGSCRYRRHTLNRLAPIVRPIGANGASDIA